MLKTALIEQQAMEARRNMALGLSLGLQQFGNNMSMQAMQQQAIHQYQPPQTMSCHTFGYSPDSTSWTCFSY